MEAKKPPSRAPQLLKVCVAGLSIAVAGIAVAAAAFSFAFNSNAAAAKAGESDWMGPWGWAFGAGAVMIPGGLVMALIAFIIDRLRGLKES